MEKDICVNCGSDDIEVIYDHDCWGAPNGIREICNECGCNRTKKVDKY